MFVGRCVYLGMVCHARLEGGPETACYFQRSTLEILLHVFMETKGNFLEKNMRICVYLCMKKTNDLKATSRLAAAKAKQVGLTQVVIAEGLGVSQSQVSRVLAGHISRRSDLLEKICMYVDDLAGKVGADQVRGNDILINAIADIWDGTTAHAEALAAVIRSLGALPRTNLNRKK